MSKVSMVVPIYNAEKFLRKCIKSILKQTFKDIELVLVNDGSTDYSLDICEEFRRKDNRVKVINKKNEGSIATRRRGIEESSSEYVMFVDADDWVDEEIVEILYTNLIKTNSDLTVCDSYKVIGNRALIKQQSPSVYLQNNRLYEKKEVINELVVAYLHGHPFPSSLCGKLYKREVLISCGSYLNNIYFFGDDLYYNLEILLKTNKVKAVSKPLYYYRAGGNTSKFMPYLFLDSVSGYGIQKKVIEEYFKDSKQSRYNGISIMLLNTFKTCLTNLFQSNLDKYEVEKKITEFADDDCIKECLDNEGVKKYFPSDYLYAIKNKQIDFLYILGLKENKKQKPKKFMIKLLTNVC